MCTKTNLFACAKVCRTFFHRILNTFEISFSLETESAIENVIVVILVVNYMTGYLKPGNLFRL